MIRTIRKEFKADLCPHCTEKIDRRLSASKDPLLLSPMVKKIPETLQLDLQLYAAAKNGSTTKLRRLLELGANPNALYVSNKRPLHLACEGGHTECAKLLLEHGADARKMDTHGISSVRIAAEHGNLELLREMKKRRFLSFLTLDHERGWYQDTPIEGAAWNGHISAARFLLRELDEGHIRSRLPRLVEIAISTNNPDLVRLAVRFGFDPNSKVGFDIPLYQAVAKRSYLVAKALLQNGAKADAAYPICGIPHTPLIKACSLGDIPMMELLLSHRASITTRYGSSTPLSSAAEEGHLEAVKYLFECRWGKALASDTQAVLEAYWMARYLHKGVARYLHEKLNPQAPQIRL